MLSHLASELSGTISGTLYTKAAWPTVSAKVPVTGPMMPRMGYVMLSDIGPGMGPSMGSESICRKRTIETPARLQSSRMYNPICVPGNRVSSLLIVSAAYLNRNQDCPIKTCAPSQYKDRLSHVWDSRVKDKTVVRPSFL